MQRTSWIKLALLAIFIYNTSIIQGFAHYIADDIREGKSKLPTREQQLAKFSEYQSLVEKLLQEAKDWQATGQLYTFDQYYPHLLQIDLKEEELGYFAHTTASGPDQLLQMAGQSLKHGYTREQQEVAFAKFKKQSPRFRTEPPEVTKSREVFFAAIRSGAFNHALWRLYLKDLWLAGLLFLIWTSEGEKKRKHWAIPNPFYFVLALVFYPLVIAYVFWRWLQETSGRLFAEAELRRTKDKLFAPFDDTDLERLQKFIQSRAHIAAWRQELRNQGLRPRHSLAAALLATAFLMVLGLSAREAVAKTLPFGANVAAQTLGQHLPRMALGDDASFIPDHDAGGFHPDCGRDCIIVEPIAPPALTVCRLNWQTVRVKPQRSPTDIDHIPRSGLVLRIAHAVSGQTNYEEALVASSYQGGSYVSVYGCPDVDSALVARGNSFCRRAA